MNSKLSLYNRIKEFIYSPDLEDLHIFSKQYFNTIIKPSFSSNKDSDNYSIIYIDFNKLNDINNIYGYQTGNKVVHQCLNLIQSVLPSNSVCARTGGDEFLFLIDNCSLESTTSFITDIYSILDAHKKEICLCSVSACGIHSSQKDNLSEMVNEADLKITEQKNNFSKELSASKWDILERKLTQNLTSFFKSLRLYNYHINTDFLKQLYVHAISSSSDLLEKNFSNNDCNFEQSDYNSTISKDKILAIYNLFLTISPTLEDINNIDYDTYSSVLEGLIRDPVTNNLTKDYFIKYLLNDCRQTFNIKYISTTFVKLYNTIFSHSATDIKLKEMVDNFIEFSNQKNLHFIQDSFSTEKGNYFISLGAGDYLLAFPSNIKINNDFINSYINSQNKIPSDLSDILYFICSSDFKLVNKDNFEQTLEELSSEGKLLKNHYKEDLITEPILKDVISRIVYDSAEYYINNIPNCNSINQKSKFIEVLSKCMINVATSLNQEQKKSNNKDDFDR